MSAIMPQEAQGGRPSISRDWDIATMLIVVPSGVRIIFIHFFTRTSPVMTWCGGLNPLP